MANRRGLLYQMLEDLRNQTGKNPDELAATLGISNATMYKRIRTGSFTYEDLFRMSETLEHITKLTQYVPDKSVKIILYSFHMDILAIVILQDCSTPNKKHYLLKTVWEQNTDNEGHS